MGRIKISTIANLSTRLKDSGFFDIEPELLLLPKPGELFQLGLGPLTFNDTATKNQLQIGRNFFKIIIKKYDNWNTEYQNIKNIFQILQPILGDINISNFQIACIDNFSDIKKDEEFNLSNYFTHFVESDFKINYDDFHLGIVPHQIIKEDELEKIVLKLRGISPKDTNYFSFKLESLFIKRNLNINFSDPKLLSDINYGHDFLDYLFVNSLSEGYRKQIGLDFEYLEQE